MKNTATVDYGYIMFQKDGYPHTFYRGVKFDSEDYGKMLAAGNFWVCQGSADVVLNAVAENEREAYYYAVLKKQCDSEISSNILSCPVYQFSSFLYSNDCISSNFKKPHFIVLKLISILKTKNSAVFEQFEPELAY